MTVRFSLVSSTSSIVGCKEGAVSGLAEVMMCLKQRGHNQEPDVNFLDFVHFVTILDFVQMLCLTLKKPPTSV